MPNIIYADIESFITKVEECANNPKKTSILKIVEDIPCRYSLSTIWAFDHAVNKHT